jgi:shikimate kinase
MMNKSNVVLIGMPGAGKSTIGVVLAKRLGFDFVDSDLVIQSRAGLRLQELIAGEGMAALRRLEEEVLLDLALVRKTVIATGGSAVYSDSGMKALRRNGRTVFLDAPLEELERRIDDMDQRGIVLDPGETFPALFRHRQPLYRRYADLTISVSGKSMETLAGEIVDHLEALPSPRR